MPTWSIHKKWACKAGISSETSNYVNLLIDLPKKHQEFLDFCDKEPNARVFSKGRATSMTLALFVSHDDRSKKSTRDVQLKFLDLKGKDYIKAFYLHHVLDYVQWWVKSGESIPDIQDILQPKRLVKKIGSLQSEEINAVKNFVTNHSAEIMQDLQSQAF